MTYVSYALLVLLGLAVLVLYFLHDKYREARNKLSNSLSEVEDLTKYSGLLEDDLTRMKREEAAFDTLLNEASNHQANFKQLSMKYGEVCISNDHLSKELEKARELAAKNLSHRKSSEIKTAKIAENFAPFLEDFPYDPEICQFLGMPIDIIAWDEDGIHIVEVKSGGAQLTPKQRNIKDLVESGKVTFEVFRIKPTDE